MLMPGIADFKHSDVKKCYAMLMLSKAMVTPMLIQNNAAVKNAHAKD